MRRPDIHLHIEKLILHGFNHVNREVLHDALTSEFTRLLSSPDFNPDTLRDAGIPKLEGGTITTSHQTDSAVMGTQIAQAVVGGLTQ